MITERTIVFGPADARCYGVLVLPSGHVVAADQSGVVICDPFGIEALAADRSLNHLTAALAMAGHAVLRFSPPGLGDSAEIPAGASIAGPWRSAIGAAIDLIRAECACSQVAVVGLRLGAVLAAEVASTRDDVDRLVLWAPVAGRPFVRELKLLGASTVDQADNFEKTDRADKTDKTEARSVGISPHLAVEAGGYGLSEASAAALAHADPLKILRRPAPEVLVIDRDDIRSAGKLITHLEGLGAQVDAPSIEGYSSMRLDDPEAGEVPVASITAMAAWISRPTVPAHPRVTDENSHAERLPTAAHLDVADRLALEVDGVHIHETSVRIPVKDDRELHGIVTRPVAMHDRPLAIVLLTTGSNPCCGAGRLHTRLARHWGAAGHTVIRIDRRGVGRSELSELLRRDDPARGEARADARNDARNAERSPGALGEAYDDTHVDDISAVEQFVRVEHGSDRVLLVGTCSGAYTAYRAALAERSGSGVHAVIAINQIIFDDHAWTTDEESPAYAIKARYELGQALRHPRRWIDLIRGDIPVVPAVRRLARFAGLRLRSLTRITVAKLRRRPAPAFGVGGDLQTIAAAGIRQTYVFDDAETGLGYLRLHFDGPTSALMEHGMLQQHTVSGAGHTFAPEWSKQWLVETLDRTLADLSR